MSYIAMRIPMAISLQCVKLREVIALRLLKNTKQQNVSRLHQPLAPLELQVPKHKKN